jgi:hypothetical protein
MSQQQEWDWPPPRRSRAEQIELESRIVEERIVLPRRQAPPRGSGNLSKRPAGIFSTIVVTILKVLIAIPLALVALGAVWFLSVLFSV